MVSGKACTMYLVRHGESEANAKHITQGHTDSPLTEKGEKEAEQLRETFADINFSAVYSSDLKRATRTADIIIAGRKLRVKTLAGLREKYFGDFEGKDHAEFVKTLKSEFYTFENELGEEEMWEHKAHPSMESDAELFARAIEILRDIASRHTGETVLVVGHRYLIRMLLVSFGYGAYKNLKDGALNLGGYAVVESDGTVFTVRNVVGAEN